MRKNSARLVPMITRGWLAPVKMPGSTAFPTLNIIGVPIRTGGIAGMT